jgi:nucleotide-binding universal stress UspA family protein
MYKRKRVLVALDGSSSAEAVVRFLLEIAGPLDMTLLLLCVVEPIQPAVADGAVVIDDFAVRRRDAEEYLATLAAALRAQGISVTWSVRRGRAAEEILAAARESDVDMVAMATHGRSGLGRLLFGSVAEAVLRQAPVPVFMIRQPSEPATTAAPSPAAAGRGGQPRERSAR